MKRRGRITTLIALILFGLILCAWIAIEVFAMRGRQTMEKIVIAVSDLQLNATKLGDARERIEGVTGKRVEFKVDPDGNRQFEYSLLVPQGGFQRLGRIYWLTTQLRFDNANLLTSKRILFTSNSYACCTAEVWQLSSLANETKSGELNVLRYDPYGIIVHLGPDASKDESVAVWNWQFSCVTSRVGCVDVRTVLPSVHPARLSTTREAPTR